MAKYDWKKLEKEYMLSDYKSVSTFLKNNEIPNNRNSQKKTKGWREKKTVKERWKDGKNNRKNYWKTIRKGSTTNSRFKNYCKWFST